MGLIEAMTMDAKARGKKLSLWQIVCIFLLSSPLQVVLRYRLAEYLRERRPFGRLSLVLASRILNRLALCPGIEFKCKQSIGAGLEIVHPHDVVIGNGAKVGRNVTIFNGVTLGNKWVEGIEPILCYPTLEDNVKVFPGAKLLGPITIGAGSQVGANAVVMKSFPPNSVIAGVPAKLIRQLGEDRSVSSVAARGKPTAEEV